MVMTMIVVMIILSGLDQASELATNQIEPDPRDQGITHGLQIADHGAGLAHGDMEEGDGSDHQHNGSQSLDESAEHGEEDATAKLALLGGQIG